MKFTGPSAAVATLTLSAVTAGGTVDINLGALTASTAVNAAGGVSRQRQRGGVDDQRFPSWLSQSPPGRRGWPKLQGLTSTRWCWALSLPPR